MTLIELQEYLGKTLTDIKAPSKTGEEHNRKMEECKQISKVSTVMVRNAGIILNRDIAIGTGKILDDAPCRNL